MEHLSLVSPVITLVLCYVVFHSIDHIMKHVKHKSVWKFAVDFPWPVKPSKQARKPHFPLPSPPSQSCTPPNGLHSAEASHQLLKEGGCWTLGVAVFSHNIRKMHKIMKANSKVLAIACKRKVPVMESHTLHEHFCIWFSAWQFIPSIKGWNVSWEFLLVRE